MPYFVERQKRKRCHAHFGDEERLVQLHIKERFVGPVAKKCELRQNYGNGEKCVRLVHRTEEFAQAQLRRKLQDGGHMDQLRVDGRTECWVIRRKWEWKNIKSVRRSMDGSTKHKGSGCGHVMFMVRRGKWLTRCNIAFHLENDPPRRPR